MSFPPSLPNHSTIGIPRFGSVNQTLTPPFLLIRSPSNEWQDQVISKIQVLRRSGAHGKSSPIKKSPPRSLPGSTVGCQQQSVPTLDSSFTSVPGSGDSGSPRRLRRRLDSGSDVSRTISPESSNSPLSPRSHHHGLSHAHQSHKTFKSLDSPTTTMSEEDGGEIEGEGEEDLEEAVGQLSLNEDEQVRFHGKASGLHLLAPQERIDGRSEGGIWKFPGARVWPPLPPTEHTQFTKEGGEFSTSMPPSEEQENLLDLYWKHVHTFLPVVYKQSFLESFRRGSVFYLLFSSTPSLISLQFYDEQFSAFRRVRFICQPRSERTGSYTHNTPSCYVLNCCPLYRSTRIRGFRHDVACWKFLLRISKNPLGIIVFYAAYWDLSSPPTPGLPRSGHRCYGSGVDIREDGDYDGSGFGYAQDCREMEEDWREYVHQGGVTGEEKDLVCVHRDG